MPAIALLLCLLPADPSKVANCDLIERNSVYDDEGRLFLDQVIFWRWDSRQSLWVADGWRRTEAGQIRATPRGWRWESPGCVVEAPQVRRSWSQYDREVAGRGGTR